MSKKKNKFREFINSNFEYYKKIGETKKLLSTDTIFITERKNHIGLDSGSAKLEATISDDLMLEIERNKISSRDFKFKIYDTSFMPSPCYRFDSDGDAHFNNGAIPLLERKVTTPHFHKFQDNGIEIAYKTKDLINNEDNLLKNQSLALAEFAKEENIIYEKLPEIYKSEELLAPNNIVFDPLEGENFYE